MAPLPTWKSSIFKYFRQGLEKVVTGWDVIQCRLGGYEIRALSVSKWPRVAGQMCMKLLQRLSEQANTFVPDHRIFPNGTSTHYLRFRHSHGEVG